MKKPWDWWIALAIVVITIIILMYFSPIFIVSVLIGIISAVVVACFYRLIEDAWPWQ